jgi:hypothetical protein
MKAKFAQPARNAFRLTLVSHSSSHSSCNASIQSKLFWLLENNLPLQSYHTTTFHWHNLFRFFLENFSMHNSNNKRADGKCTTMQDQEITCQAKNSAYVDGQVATKKATNFKIA